ncbi:glycosyltransferase [Candidatus Woesearchaeota archaeon]|nr:glycosyltransferase [Candidatus Woesearchaeota archaeon]
MTLYSDSPLVGIVVCTYNRPDSLEKALDVLSRQDYQNIQVVVVDDYSECSEKNKQVCESFSGKITYLRNQKNMGISYTRNRGIEYLLNETDASLITMLDDDDWWPDYRLTKGVKVMKPGVGMSYGIQKMADENLRTIHEYPCNTSYWKVRLRALLFGTFFFPAKTYMFNSDFLRELQLENGNWYCDYICKEDIELGIRALYHAHSKSEWRVEYIDNLLAKWVQKKGLKKFFTRSYQEKDWKYFLNMLNSYLSPPMSQLVAGLSPFTRSLPHSLRFGFI